MTHMSAPIYARCIAHVCISPFSLAWRDEHTYTHTHTSARHSYLDPHMRECCYICSHAHARAYMQRFVCACAYAGIWKITNKFITYEWGTHIGRVHI